MPLFKVLALQERNRLEREKRMNAQPRVDQTLVGTIKVFFNDWKIVFHRNGAYYLVDPLGNSEHIDRYSNRERMFGWLGVMDNTLQFAETAFEMGIILFAYTNKRNIWLHDFSK